MGRTGGGGGWGGIKSIQVMEKGRESRDKKK